VDPGIVTQGALAPRKGFLAADLVATHANSRTVCSRLGTEVALFPQHSLRVGGPGLEKKLVYTSFSGAWVIGTGAVAAFSACASFAIHALK